MRSSRGSSFLFCIPQWQCWSTKTSRWCRQFNLVTAASDCTLHGAVLHLIFLAGRCGQNGRCSGCDNWIGERCVPRSCCATTSSHGFNIDSAAGSTAESRFKGEVTPSEVSVLFQMIKRAISGVKVRPASGGVSVAASAAGSSIEPSDVMASLAAFTQEFAERIGDPSADSPMTVMRQCIARVISNQSFFAPRDWAQLAKFGEALERAGVLEREASTTLADIRAAVDEGRVTGHQLVAIAITLAFRIGSSRAWTMMVYRQLLLPTLAREVRAQQFCDILLLERLIYNDFIRQVESEEHFRTNYASLAPQLREAGLAARRAADLAPLAIPSTPKPRIAFLLFNPSILAHTTLLLEYLAGYRELAVQPFVPKVYVLYRTGAPLTAALRERNVDVEFLDEQSDDIAKDDFRRLLVLRERLTRDETTAVVWVSIPAFMVFASAMGLAPVQIWWSMKYHGIETPEIDGYVTGGSLMRSKIIGEKAWRTAPVAYDVLPPAEAAAQARRLRDTYRKYEVVLGTLAREQKLTDPRFLDTIVQLLQRHPSAAYLWTGRVPLREIQAAFERGGVADRCFFVGWVDTKVYAQVIDIFLDSFPFPCATTVLESMAVGKPVVLYQSEESFRTGIHGIISPMINGAQDAGLLRDRLVGLLRNDSGRLLYMCARDPAEYTGFADELIFDTRLRGEVGAALQRMVKEFFVNRKLMAEGYTRHFAEIIQEVRSRTAR